jgi:subtilisin family serine protease
MSLKINGGPKGTGNLASAVEAVKYATRMGADICNLSWGTSSYTASLEQVMKESDMLFIAAAGNTGDDNNNAPVYPASLKLDNLISVTFVDSAGELTGLSNYGSNTVDLAAPGEDILSTIVGNYSSMSG